LLQVEVLYEQAVVVTHCDEWHCSCIETFWCSCIETFWCSCIETFWCSCNKT
jgi:hypothetical protein